MTALEKDHASNRFDIDTLKRLQQDAFQDILKLKQRGSGSAFRARSVSSVGGADAGGGTFTGSLTMRYGMFPSTTAAETTRFAVLEDAGPACEVRIKADTRGGSEAPLYASFELASDWFDPDVQLRKALVKRRTDPHFEFTFAPFHGTAADIMPTLNANDGAGLTSLVKRGCPLHHMAAGTGLGFGAGVGDTVHLSLGFLQRQEEKDDYLTAPADAAGSDEAGVVSSLFGQAACFPTSWLALSVVGLTQQISENYKDTMSASFVRRGVAELLRAVRRTPPADAGALGGMLRSKLGICAAVRSGNASLSGWGAIGGAYSPDGTLLSDGINGKPEFGLKFSGLNPATGGGFQVGVGMRRPPHEEMFRDDKTLESCPKLVGEASMTFPVPGAGADVTMTPGLVFFVDDDTPRSIMVLQSTWAF
ncbi:unnamed protein product [Pedinophyceae sp. YPF-701]|nr:unnamed protein product [Pedinophyceae sp. YPF-701]